MTKKEFLSRAYGQDRLSLADLAEEAGVKFDPESGLPKLPPLSIFSRRAGLSNWIGGSTNKLDTSLSREEAQEVVRRCELIPKLREFFYVRWGDDVTLQDVLQYLDGTLSVPHPMENVSGGWCLCTRQESSNTPLTVLEQGRILIHSTWRGKPVSAVRNCERCGGSGRLSAFQ